MKDILLELHSACPHEAARDPSYRWENKLRNAPGLILQYTWSGEGRLERGRRIHPCPAGRALLMRHGDPTRYFYPPDTRTPWVFAWINFRGAEAVWSAFIQRHGDVVPLETEGAAVGLLREITRLYQEKGFHDRYHTSEVLARLVSAIGRELAQERSSGPPVVERARDYLRDHHRRPLNIKEVAAHFGLSREHFARIFRRETGETPAAYLRDLRLQTARQLLRGTRMSVREVAELSGFGSSTHFCRTFYQVENSSPNAYRERGK